MDIPTASEYMKLYEKNKMKQGNTYKNNIDTKITHSSIGSIMLKNFRSSLSNPKMCVFVYYPHYNDINYYLVIADVIFTRLGYKVREGLNDSDEHGIVVYVDESILHNKPNSNRSDTGIPDAYTYYKLCLKKTLDDYKQTCDALKPQESNDIQNMLQNFKNSGYENDRITIWKLKHKYPAETGYYFDMASSLFEDKGYNVKLEHWGGGFGDISIYLTFT
jgi:hypothetical protein